MDLLYWLASAVIIAILIFLVFEKNAKVSGLLGALHEEQNLKKELAIRESERQQEFDFVLTQGIDLVCDIVDQVYASHITITGVSFEFNDELYALSNILKKTPQNYLSSKIGEFEHPNSDEFSANLQKVITKAAGIKKLRYLQIVVVIRVMLLKKIDLAKAVNIILSS